jgi:3-methyladenine DNA glycosylase AlkD
MTQQLDAIRIQINKAGDSHRAELLQRFFKTKKGEYGYGDKFLGLTVPQSRVIAKKYRDLSLTDIESLLKSPLHEERLIALLILVDQFQKSKDLVFQKTIYDFYLSHTRYINNWDLVDTSAHKIIGEYLVHTNSGISLLKKLAKSKLIWERRIAIIATFAFLKIHTDKPTYEIAEQLLHDSHDLIQKAVGWALREAGKLVSEEHLVSFLLHNYQSMPRTMLRYSIERFPEEIRKKYL